ncbi:MAG: PAS domain-containing protein [Opitutaceae bacterium]
MSAGRPFPEIAWSPSGCPEDQAELEQILVNAFLENIPDSVYFKDRESRFVAVSHSKAERHGEADPERLVGKSDADLYPPSHARKTRQDEEAIMATGIPKVGQVERLTLPDGGARWSRTTKLALRDETGRIVGTFGISEDVTAARRPVSGGRAADPPNRRRLRRQARKDGVGRRPGHLGADHKIAAA